MAIINFKNIFTSGFDQDALPTNTPGEQILNFATLKTTGDLADGIFAGADGVSIRNFGRIQTSGLAAEGVHVEGNNARISNFGSIKTSGNDTSDATADGIIVFGDAFQISNFGDVRVTGDFASGLVGIGDDGSILNAGYVNSSSIESIVVGIFGDGGQVVNRGRIDVGSSDSSGLLTRGEHASIINTGQVNLTAEFDQAMILQGANSEADNHGTIVINAQYSFGMAAHGIGHTLVNDGSITAHGIGDIGMAATGSPFTPEGTDLHVFNSGQISIDGTSSFGVALGLADIPGLSASHGLVRNSGSITTHGDGAPAIVMIGDSHELINSGKVTANGGIAVSDLLGPVQAAGVLVSGDNVSIENERTGTITSNHAGSAAVELNIIDRDGVANAELSSLVDNSGLIKGVDLAISGGAGHEMVINHGRIVGDVRLGEGADTFDFGKNGTVSGDVFLGGGNDTVIVEKGSGTSHIGDFASGDEIDLSAFFSNFNELVAHSHQQGANVVISLGHNDTLVLEHVQLATGLHPNDFIFS